MLPSALLALLCTGPFGLAATTTRAQGIGNPPQETRPAQSAAPTRAPATGERLTHAQRFERSPGVLGTSIRTLRKEMVKDYANESLGYLALDLEDRQLTPVSKGGGLMLNLGDKLQFASRSDDVPAKAKPVLDGIAELLLDNPDYLIQIMAHTDSRGRANDNMRLSQRRADAVKRYFQDRGIEEVRLIAIGRGEAEPLKPVSGRSATRAERAVNRRVELLIQPMDLPAPSGTTAPTEGPPMAAGTPRPH